MIRAYQKKVEHTNNKLLTENSKVLREDTNTSRTQILLELVVIINQQKEAARHQTHW